MDRITSRLADGLLAVAALPPGQAHLLAVHSARVVSEAVVAGPAKRRTRRVVVICRAFDAHPKLRRIQLITIRIGPRQRLIVYCSPVSDAGIFALVVQRVPLVGGQDHARE